MDAWNLYKVYASYLDITLLVPHLRAVPGVFAAILAPHRRAVARALTISGNTFSTSWAIKPEVSALLSWYSGNSCVRQR